MSMTLSENITKELTELEKDTLVPMLIDLISRTNVQNRLTSKKVIKWFISRGYYVSLTRLRKMIAYTRLMNIFLPKVLMAANNGYYLTGVIKIESLKGNQKKLYT